MVEFNNEPEQGNISFNPTERFLKQKPKKSRAKTLVPAIVMLAAMAGLAYLGWNAYEENVSGPSDPSKIPVMKADETPYKVEPENQAEENIPGADKKVYETIANNKADSENTDNAGIKIISPAEEPVDRNSIKPAVNAQQVLEKAEPAGGGAAGEEASPQLKDATSKETTNVEEKPVATTAEKTEAAPSSAQEKEEKPVAAPEEKPAAKAEEKPTEKPAEKPVAAPAAKTTTAKPLKKKEEKPKPKITASSIKVQLGAFKTSEEAKTAWNSMNKKHGKLLEGLAYSVEKKDVPNKGVFYRLQAGPLKSDAAAKVLCKKLGEVKQGCFIVN